MAERVWYNSSMKKQLSKKNKAINICLYIVSALLIFTGIIMIIKENVLFPGQYNPPPSPTPSESPTPLPWPSASATPERTTEPTPVPTPVPNPVRIYFPRFEIQCDIQPVGLSDDGSVATVDAADIAAWYQDSPIPGEDGNSQINGHVRYGGKKGSFSVLADFKENDEVIIELADGSFRYFYVESVAVYSYADFPKELLALDGEARMTLITCSGEWSTQYGTSKNRIVVICKPKV